MRWVKGEKRGENRRCRGCLEGKPHLSVTSLAHMTTDDNWLPTAQLELGPLGLKRTSQSNKDMVPSITRNLMVYLPRAQKHCRRAESAVWIVKLPRAWTAILGRSNSRIEGDINSDVKITRAVREAYDGKEKKETAYPRCTHTPCSSGFQALSSLL